MLTLHLWLIPTRQAWASRDAGEAWLPSHRADRGAAPLGRQRAPSGPQRQSHVMAPARVLLLLSGRPESVGFAQSVCGLLGAGPGPGPWPTHCGWKPGQLLLSDRPFPGASARLPLQVGSRAPAGGAGSRRCRLGPGRETRGRASRPDAASSPSRGVPVFESPFRLGSPHPSGSLPPAAAFLPFRGPGPAAQASGNRAAHQSGCGPGCGHHSAVQRPDRLVDSKDTHPARLP